MPNVSQAQSCSSLSTYAEKDPVDNPYGLWTAIQQDKSTTDENQIPVAIAMVKDLLVRYCPIYYVAYEESFNSSGRYEPYSIMLTTACPTFAKRASKKRNKKFLGWVHTLMTEVGLSEQLAVFESEIANNLPG